MSRPSPGWASARGGVEVAGPFERLVAVLGDRVARRRDDRVDAHCPAHDDREPSLSAWLAPDGWARIRCHAGCSREAVLDALGLKVSDLGPPLGPWPGSVQAGSVRPAARPAPVVVGGARATEAWQHAVQGARRELAAGGGPGLAYLGTRLDGAKALSLAWAGEVGVDALPVLDTCITVPLRDLAEEVRDVAYRAVGKRGFRRLAGVAQGAALAMVSPGMLAEADGGDLLVVEGVVDFLAARGLGIAAVLGLPGTGTASSLGAALADEIRSLRAEGMYGPRRIVLATDADAAGDRAAVELAQALAPLGVAPFRARPLQGRDLTDTLVAAGEAS